MRNIPTPLAGGRPFPLALALAVLVSVCSSSAPARTDERSVLRMVYSGNRRSELEPCGCRINQQGGIDFEANHIGGLRQTDVPLLLVDAGGFVNPDVGPNQFLKSRRLLEAMSRIGYDVLNVGRADASFGLGFLREQAKDRGFTLLSANMRDADGVARLFQPYVIKEYPVAGERPFRIAITGFTTPDFLAPTGSLLMADASPGGKSASQPAASRPTISPTPTPRISPTPSAAPQPPRWHPALDHLSLRAFATPTPTPLSPQQKQALEEMRRSIQTPEPQPEASAGGKLEELREKLRLSATAPISAETEYSAPSSQPAIPSVRPAVHDPATSLTAVRSDPAPAPKGATFSVSDPVRDLSELVPELRKKADYVVVLAYCPQPLALQVANNVAGMDLLISGMELAAPPEPQRRGNCVIVGTGFGGRSIGETRVFWQDPPGRYNSEGKTVYVTADLKSDPAIAGILAAYREETRTLFPTQPQAPRYTLANAENCKACHVAEYEHWSSTPHAHAMQTLTGKGQDQNPDCLPCHTTSYRKDNGFYDIRTTPSFADVQCEACHGPGLHHARDMRFLANAANPPAAQRKQLETQAKASMPPRLPAEALCLTCHTPENDDHFVYSEKIERVKHRAAAPRLEARAP